MIIGIIAVVLALLAVWVVNTRRSLAAMDENIDNTMNQIGVQLSSCFDALIALLGLTKGYAANESQTLIETVKSRRSVIAADSTPEDVLKQEGVISEVLVRISVVAGEFPELKANENYRKCMNAVDRYEKMVCTSRLIYNDSVTKLNRPPHVPRQSDRGNTGLPSAGLSGDCGEQGGYARKSFLT